MRAEMLRPLAFRSDGFLQKQRDRIARCFDACEQRAGELDIVGESLPNLAQITVGIACGYQDWRGWLWEFRLGRSNLDAWYNGFSQRPALQETNPRTRPNPNGGAFKCCKKIAYTSIARISASRGSIFPEKLEIIAGKKVSLRTKVRSIECLAASARTARKDVCVRPFPSRKGCIAFSSAVKFAADFENCSLVSSL